jgi:hypothetical protein
MLPLNWKIYKLDIEKANSSGVAEWELSVDYVNDYQLGQMSPDSLYNFAKRVTTKGNEELLQQFWWDWSRQVGDVTTKEVYPLTQLKNFCQLTESTKSGTRECYGAKKDLDNKLWDWMIGVWKKAAK